MCWWDFWLSRSDAVQPGEDAGSAQPEHVRVPHTQGPAQGRQASRVGGSFWENGGKTGVTAVFSDLDQYSYESADSDRNPDSDPDWLMKLSLKKGKIEET